jgi:FKBP-type peptidyl-prolyl cis-trans isomerase
MVEQARLRAMAKYVARTFQCYPGKMRLFLLLIPAILMAQNPPPATNAPPATKAPSAAPAPGALTTDDQKIVYAVGLSMAQSLTQLGLSKAELEIVKQALTDSAAGKPAEDLNTWGPKINAFAQARVVKAAAAEKASSKAFLDAAAAEPGASRAASGMVYRELTAGTGASPKATDKVRVNYRGTFMNGTEFDSSYKRNMPAEFTLNGVIPCWTEGVQRMKVGGKSKLVCPSDIAYGDQGRPPIPPGATLVFEIELLAINPPAAAK